MSNHFFQSLSKKTILMGAALLISFSWLTCKPLIVLARKSSLGEHRNDHQIATASKFVDTAGVIVLTNEQEITSAINDVESGKCISNAMNNKNLNKLINELREFSGIES